MDVAMEDASSPLDAQVDALLAPLSLAEEAAYFGGLQAAGAAPGLAVRRCAAGKGLFACRAFAAGDVVLREAPLVAIQQAANRPAALVCARCFRYVGSVEAQIAARLVGKPGAPAGVEELASGAWRLPLADGPAFALPPPHACRGGCGELYCGSGCEAAAWARHHRALCSGPGGNASSRDALISLAEHTQRTNDVFGLVAQLVAAVGLEAEAVASTSPGSDAFACLRAAWRPFAAAHRVPWADCVSRPDDVAVGDEASFRASLARLADSSRRRLAAALPRLAASFPALFHVRTFSHIMGLFELNNLDVVVESPVERFFLAVDDLEGPQRGGAMAVTQPLLDALGSEYATAMDGTGFFPFVACANHACDPSAASSKAETDVDGGAVLVAVRDISAGEEVTICYIETSGVSLHDRRRALADYGFVCECARCVREEAAAGRRAGKTK